MDQAPAMTSQGLGGRCWLPPSLALEWPMPSTIWDTQFPYLGRLFLRPVCTGVVYTLTDAEGYQKLGPHVGQAGLIQVPEALPSGSPFRRFGHNPHLLLKRLDF
jgi:hypothetical protein